LLEALLLGVALPGLVGLAAALACARGHDGRIALPLAVGFGVFAALVALVGWPAMPPVQATERIGWFSCAVAFLTIGNRVAAPSARGVVRCLPPLLGAASVLGVQRLAHPDAIVLSGLGAAAATFVLRAGVERVARDREGPSGPFVLAATATAVAVALALTGSALLAQLAGAVAAAIGFAAVLTWMRPHRRLSENGASVGAAILGALGFAGVLYGETPVATALLLAVAPWLGVAAATTRTSLRAAGVAAAAATLAFAGAVIAIRP